MTFCGVFLAFCWACICLDLLNNKVVYSNLAALGFRWWCEFIEQTSAESTRTQAQFKLLWIQTRCESWWWPTMLIIVIIARNGVGSSKFELRSFIPLLTFVVILSMWYAMELLHSNDTCNLDNHESTTHIWTNTSEYLSDFSIKHLSMRVKKS